MFSLCVSYLIMYFLILLSVFISHYVFSYLAVYSHISLCIFLSRFRFWYLTVYFLILLYILISHCVFSYLTLYLNISLCIFLYHCVSSHIIVYFITYSVFLSCYPSCITMMAHEYLGISNHQQLECLFKSGDNCILLTRDQWCGKYFHIMTSWSWKP